MMKNTMPPQAYTRDTLVKAIDWVSNQPESMRTQAKTADALVALYLQSKRRTQEWSGNGVDYGSDFPVSGEAFKEDLRSLARDMEQFTVPPTQQSLLHQHQQMHQAAHQPSLQPQRPLPESPPQQVPAMSPQNSVNTSLKTTPSSDFQWTVDPLSLKRARALQQRLNLSSESEALRMMLSLGFEHFQNLLP